MHQPLVCTNSPSGGNTFQCHEHPFCRQIYSPTPAVSLRYIHSSNLQNENHHAHTRTQRCPVYRRLLPGAASPRRAHTAPRAAAAVPMARAPPTACTTAACPNAAARPPHRPTEHGPVGAAPRFPAPAPPAPLPPPPLLPVAVVVAAAAAATWRR
jgi:hypothetical protein